jgi:hypothetical protein
MRCDGETGAPGVFQLDRGGGVEASHGPTVGPSGEEVSDRLHMVMHGMGMGPDGLKLKH